MSWHFNDYSNKSLLVDLVKLVNEEHYITIFMDNGVQFVITDEDDVDIGAEAMMIATKNEVVFINTNKIEYLKILYCMLSLNKIKN